MQLQVRNSISLPSSSPRLKGAVFSEDHRPGSLLSKRHLYLPQPLPRSPGTQLSTVIPTGSGVRPEGGQVYEVLPRQGGRLVMQKAAGGDPLQVDSVEKTEAPNASYNTHTHHAEQGWQEQNRGGGIQRWDTKVGHGPYRKEDERMYWIPGL